MRIAGLQLDMAWEDPTASFTRIAPWIDAAVAQRAHMLVLPETYACGFSMATDRIAEPPKGPSTRFLADAARQHGIWLVGSVPIREPGMTKPFNTLLLASPEGAIHRYRKQKPFTHGGEAEHFAAGSEDLTVTIAGLRFSFFVCYDLRFADLFWNRAAETDVYVVIANWPEKRREHWRLLLRARAIENQAYVIGINRVGHGGGLTYAGDSAIIDPMGHMMTYAAGQEALLLADIDAATVHRVRAELPFFDDR